MFNSKFLFYIVKRILFAILTIFCVITITFFMMQAVPGGPFVAEKTIPPATIAALKVKYGLDKPLFIQYLNYLKNAITFDFGPSFKYRNVKVMDSINMGFKVSGTIGLIGGLLAIIIGIPLGSIAATHQNKPIDRIIMVLTTASVAMPSFVIATILSFIFISNLGWFTANALDTSPIGIIKSYTLPILCLSFYPMAYITRLTRSSTLDVLNQDFIRTAKAKGLSSRKILFKHTLRNSLTPVITYVGPEFAYIITGSLVVEQIFSIPGLGRTFINSIEYNDYPMIMATTIFLTDLMVVMLLVSDILYKVANPRIDFD
jgi:oligopeptide transport system permease protein